jgi:hypothetical protein
MRRLILTVCFFLLMGASVQAQRPRQIQWDDPDNPPGTVLKYTVYWGVAKLGPYLTGKVDIVAPTMTATITLPKGVYYMVCTASNTENESPYSNEIEVVVRDNAKKPINLRVSN